ncbi:MAG TPA: hypothetical protein VH158_10145, partial [Gemmatimonadales bacterium]|nr:hypothetical protein [Gemmatimonadales bacterium]
ARGSARCRTARVPPPGPSHPTPPPRPPATIRYGPNAARYLVHRQLHITQTVGTQTQTQDLGARAFLAVALTGPADSVGYPASFKVDSLVADSGTPAPLVDNMLHVRSLVFLGRVAPRGEFVNATPSDSTLAQAALQLLGNLRDFLPRLPADGLKPGTAWTDTVETVQKPAGAEVSRRSFVHASAAAAWEDHGGVRSLRVVSDQTYRVTGSGKNLGQPFELSGAGTGTGTVFIAADGRYLGGESRDSTALTVHLPVQGMDVPVIQVTRTTVAVLP